MKAVPKGANYSIGWKPKLKRFHLISNNEPVMSYNGKKKALTFGDFIVAVYDVCAKRKAKEIVRRAVNAHVVVFRRQQRVVIT